MNLTELLSLLWSGRWKTLVLQRLTGCKQFLWCWFSQDANQWMSLGWAWSLLANGVGVASKWNLGTVLNWGDTWWVRWISLNNFLDKLFLTWLFFPSLLCVNYFHWFLNFNFSSFNFTWFFHFQLFDNRFLFLSQFLQLLLLSVLWPCLQNFGKQLFIFLDHHIFNWFFGWRHRFQSKTHTFLLQLMRLFPFIEIHDLFRSHP